MKNMIMVTFMTIFGFHLNAQQLNSEYIQKHTAYFTIENGELKGKGKRVFEKMTRNAQFINYGEIHGSKEVSLVTKAMMDLLAKNSFQYFALEVGPHSAEVLSQLSSNPSKTVANLNAFNSAYSVKGGDDTAIPIPFFEHVSDAEFLQVARQNKMQLWGLDQEYYYAAFFLMDQMVKTVQNKTEAIEVEQLKLQAQQVMFKHFMAEAQDKIDDPFGPILKEQAVINFFNAFDENNSKAQMILKDLKISWDIYTRWRSGSHQDRISYMRNNFIKNYNEAVNRGEKPKVFTKIGCAHASKVISNSSYDIGSLTEELAQKNGTLSVSINTWVPFSRSEKGIVKNVDCYYSYKRYKEFLTLAKQDQYAIVDLRQIRKDLKAGKIELPTNGDYHALKILLNAYDYQIMLPVTDGTTLNRKTH